MLYLTHCDKMCCVVKDERRSRWSEKSHWKPLNVITGLCYPPLIVITFQVKIVAIFRLMLSLFVLPIVITSGFYCTSVAISVRHICKHFSVLSIKICLNLNTFDRSNNANLLAQLFAESETNFQKLKEEHYSEIAKCLSLNNVATLMGLSLIQNADDLRLKSCSSRLA